jgi:hypothetical protein
MITHGELGSRKKGRNALILRLTMAISQMSKVIQYLRRAVLLRDGGGLTDGQLLDANVSRGNEAAVAALVGRHGPMVYGMEYDACKADWQEKIKNPPC